MERFPLPYGPRSNRGEGSAIVTATDRFGVDASRAAFPELGTSAPAPRALYRLPHMPNGPDATRPGRHVGRFGAGPFPRRWSDCET
jgi:hypothetical protein